MRKVSVKRIISMIIISIVIISEVYLMLSIINAYRSIYRILWLLPLIYVQLHYLIKVIVTKDFVFSTRRIMGLCGVTLVAAILVFITIPKYTYNEAKELVKDMYKEQKIEFKEYSKGQDSIDVTENDSIFFIRSRGYYYGFKVNGEKVYSVVNPMSGEIHKMKKEWWQEDKH